MKQTLKKICKFLIRKGPYIALGALLFYVLTHTAFAADPAEIKEKTYQSLATLISIAIKMLNVFLWPFLLIIGELMDSDLIIGPGMEERLLGIWVQVRNLVNIGFVIMLLVIALYNVVGVGGGEGNLALKTALPKLVLGLILVNFTFIGGKVLIDVSNVATTVAFALPEVVEDFDFGNTRAEFEQTVCKKTDGTFWLKTDEVPISTKLFCAMNEDGTQYSGSLNELMSATYFKQLNANNVGIVMAVNMGALESLALLKPEGIKDLSDLIVNGLFSVVMYFLFAASYITLGLVLLARIVVLWVALALSPIVVLFYVVPQIKEAAGSNLDIMEKVTKHLLAPIIIGVVLTIGFLMLSAMAGLGDSFQDFAKSQSGELMAADFLVSGVEDMEKFIIAIATVMIIWTGVFAAAEGTYASFATNYIKGLGEKVGTALAKAPLYATTIPIGTPESGTTTTPMAALGLLDKGLDALNYGTFAQGKEEELAKAVLPEGAYEKLYGSSVSRNPKENARDTLAELQAAQGELSQSTLQTFAERLLSDIRTSGSKEAKAVETRVEALRDSFKPGAAGGVEQAQQLGKIYGEIGEEVGYKSDQASSISRGLKGVTEVTKTETVSTTTPAPEATPKGADEKAGTKKPEAPKPTTINVGNVDVSFPADQAPTGAALTALRGIADLSTATEAEIDAIIDLTDAQRATVKAAKAAAATPPAQPARPAAG